MVNVIKEIKKLFDDWFDWIGRLCRFDWFEVYFNVYMYIFDFYFFYLSLKDKVDFDMDMGGRLEGIGVCLV